MRSTDFVALYRGQTVAEARLVAVTAEPRVVAQVIRALVGNREQTEGHADGTEAPLRAVRAEGDTE